MFLAVAVEHSKHPKNKNQYKIWYLETNAIGDVVGIGVKTKEELIASLFENYRQTGKSNWRAFLKESERSTPIELFDFISININDNTHFGMLPTLSEFQSTLDALKARFEIRSIA